MNLVDIAERVGKTTAGSGLLIMVKRLVDLAVNIDSDNRAIGYVLGREKHSAASIQADMIIKIKTYLIFHKEYLIALEFDGSF